MPQPTRSGRTRPARRFDKTQLKAAHYGYNVHRDYAAHFFRWGFINKNRAYEKRILDVGCGQDQPLLRVLMGNKSLIPTEYNGIDLNKQPDNSICPAWATIFWEFDFTSDFIELKGPYDTVACFEVIEHMEPEDGLALLTNIKSFMNRNSTLYLSTPIFNGAAAVNHIHEYEVQELQDLIEEVGLSVRKRWGTFASKPEIVRIMSESELEIYQKLENYYGNEVMSIIFAPLYPDFSRNNLWEITL